MQNPFSSSGEFFPERIDPIPPGFITFREWMTTYFAQEGLNAKQQKWFLDQLMIHIPLYLLIFWQMFPEWELINKQIAESKILLSAAVNRRSPRYLCIAIKGEKVAETII